MASVSPSRRADPLKVPADTDASPLSLLDQLWALSVASALGTNPLDGSEVTCCQFDASGRLLAVGYATGVQVWTIESAAAEEVFSYKSPSAYLLHFLQVPVATSRRATLAVCLADEVNSVSVFNFAVTPKRVIAELKLPDKVLSIQSSAHFVAIGTKDATHLFSADTLNAVSNVPVRTCSPCALGQRWLAFCAPVGGVEAEFTLTTSSVWDARQAVASAYRIGTTGHRFWQANSTPQASGSVASGSGQQLWGVTTAASNSTAAAAAGNADFFSSNDVVVVRDLILSKDLKRVKTPKQGWLSFDPSGGLLVASSTESQTIIIYTMPDAIARFRLERGLTPTTITCVSFSPNLVAVTSSRGTTHVFPFSIDGKQPTPASHASARRPPKPKPVPLWRESVDGILQAFAAAGGVNGDAPDKDGEDDDDDDDDEGGENGGFVLVTPAAEDQDDRGGGSSEPLVIAQRPLRRLRQAPCNAPLCRFVDGFLRLCSGTGVVEDFTFEIVSPPDSNRLYLDVNAHRRFDLKREPHDETVQGNMKLSGILLPVPPTGRFGNVDDATTMFEIDTRDSCPEPLWTDPNFVFGPISAESSASTSSSKPVSFVPAAMVAPAPASPPGMLGLHAPLVPPSPTDFNTWSDGWFTPAPLPVEANRDDQHGVVASAVTSTKSSSKRKKETGLKKA